MQSPKLFTAIVAGAALLAGCRTKAPPTPEEIRAQAGAVGKLTPESFALQHPVTFGEGCISHLVEGEFIDVDDRTYAGSIFRDGSTVRDRAAQAAPEGC